MENENSGEEILIEAGLSMFPDLPWRLKAVSGRGDHTNVVGTGSYQTEDALQKHLDRLVKSRLKKGFKIELYKIDDLDIDWLNGIGVDDEEIDEWEL